MRFLLALALAVWAAVPARARWDDRGRYIVTHVLIDGELDNNEQRFFGDDPRLVGRFVDIAANRLHMDDDLACTQPGRAWGRRTVAALLRQKMLHRSAGGARYPKPGDIGLTGVRGTPVDMVDYRCLGPDTGVSGGIPGHDWSGATAFPLGSGRAALVWRSEVVLLIVRAGLAPAPRPTFNCARARSLVERTICADPILAGWDRSVARAFVLLRDGSDEAGPVDDRTALIASQRRWVAERDACGANRACLKDQMSQRTEALMQRQYRR